MSETLFAVAGDWHGNLGTARAAIRTLKAEGIHLLFHVGDLAVRWPGPKKGRFDARLEQLLADADIEFLFIDGNHDNHPELRQLPLQPDGTRQLSAHTAYIPRGTVIERVGLRIGGLGGAYSIDRRHRTEGRNLWADLEEPTVDEARLLVQNGPCDILLTHDAPACVMNLTSGLRLPASIRHEADGTRHLLQVVTAQLKPRLAFCGHWHQRRTDTLVWPDGSFTEVHVLNDDTSCAGNLVRVKELDSVLSVETITISP